MPHENSSGVARPVGIRERLLAPLAGLLGVAALSMPAPAQLPPTTSGIETIEEPHVLLDAVPIRPLVVSPTGNRVWAVNVQGNCVQEFYTYGNPVRTFQVPWNPISIAYYPSTDPAYPGEKLLVVCRGTYALVAVDLTSGKIDRLVRLPAQPADLIVDPAPNDPRAFVSCQADDVVVDIDLRRMTIDRTFKIPGKTPTSLFFDANGDVMVAPLHSGNNSGVHKSPNFRDLQAQKLGILDFDRVATTGLPDEDLFRCVRAPGTTVQAVARSLGTLLYSAGYNAATNSWWVLHTDANNKHPGKQTEADIRGDFAKNRLAIHNCATLQTTFVDLDDTDPVTPGVQYLNTRSIGHPDGLAIAQSGWAFIVGTQTDNVVLLDPAGNVAFEWDLPPGSIPRQVVWSEVRNTFFVHCWGRNTVEAFGLVWPPTHLGTFQLGFDPTSAARSVGRRLFYDGTNSLHGNLSCETCHAYGEMDFLAWNLSHVPGDDKGPLVTQTLRGIDGTMPFHWRGEQQKGIADFNPAFENLLGGQQLTATQLSQFTEYMLALRGDANPHQAADRLPTNAKQPPLKLNSPLAYAVAGAHDFRGDCLKCHSMPTGSNNEIQLLGVSPSLNPRRQRFEVGTFNALWKKHQDRDRSTSTVDTVSVTFAPGTPGLAATTMEYPLLGYGFGHAGTVNSLHEFVEIPSTIVDAAGIAHSPPPPQLQVNIAAFIDQFDQRMAPMSHVGYLLNQASPPSTVSTDIPALLTQAAAGNGDVVAFGTSVINGVSRQLRWRYVPATAEFVPDAKLPTVPPPPPYDLAFFGLQASNGVGSNVFIGLPRGTSTGFATDYDMDDLVNQEEVVIGTLPYVKDTDGDGSWDGHEVNQSFNPLLPSSVPNDTQSPSVSARVLSVTTRNAVLAVEANEPVTLRVDYWVPGPIGIATRSVSSTTHARLHRIVLDDLEASTGGSFLSSQPPAGWPTTTHTYSVEVHATDLAGNPPTITSTLTAPPPFYAAFGPGITASPFQVHPPGEVVMDSLGVTSSSLVGTTLHVSIKCDVHNKAGVPGMGVSNYVPIYRVIKNGVPVAATGGATQTWFSIGPVAYSAIPTFLPNLLPGLPGPFLISPVPTTNGNAPMSFQVPNVNPGDSVVLNLEFIGQAATPWDPNNPSIMSFEQWDMPSSPAAARKIVLQ